MADYISGGYLLGETIEVVAANGIGKKKDMAVSKWKSGRDVFIIKG